MNHKAYANVRCHGGSGVSELSFANAAIRERFYLTVSAEYSITHEANTKADLNVRCHTRSGVSELSFSCASVGERFDLALPGMDSMSVPETDRKE